MLVSEDSLCPRKLPDVSGTGLGEAGPYTPGQGVCCSPVRSPPGVASAMVTPVFHAPTARRISSHLSRSLRCRKFRSAVNTHREASRTGRACGSLPPAGPPSFPLLPVVINGWAPRRVDSFEKIDKVCALASAPTVLFIPSCPLGSRMEIIVEKIAFAINSILSGSDC